LAIGLLTLASFLFFLSAPFPQTTYFPQLIFPQPQAFVPALLYLGALIGYWRKGDWQESYIEHLLMLSLIVGFIGEALFISSSSQLFDTLFNAAHILKLISYIGILAGLLMSIFSIFRKAETSIEALSEAHAQLQLHSTELAGANQALSEAHAQLQARSDELTQTNQDLETLLYVISHDLKEPLRAIESFSHLVNRRYAKRLDEKGQDFLRRIENAAKRLRTLINDILTLSRAQRMEVLSEEVASEVIVQEVLARLERLLQETGADMNIAPNLPQLQVNKLWATQAIYNLVSNALKYGIIENGTREGEPPEVEIVPYHGPEGTGLAIKDRGLGVPEEQRERIFQLFQRAVGREIEGTGAGLAIVRQIAERHGGHAWVQPRKGGGSEFIITCGPAEKQ
jgi:signal transduction histidine kinase